MNKMEVYSKRLKALIKLGVFSLKRFFNHSVGASDIVLRQSGLGKSDAGAVVDDINKGAEKPFADAGAAVDLANLNPEKALIESSAFSDSSDRDIGKNILENATAADIFERIAAYIRSFSDSYAASDLAIRSPLKPVTDAAVTGDQSVKVPLLAKIDTIGSTDAGVLLNQDYVDNSGYFADDYVGTKRTF